MGWAVHSTLHAKASEGRGRRVGVAGYLGIEGALPDAFRGRRQRQSDCPGSVVNHRDRQLERAVFGCNAGRKS